MNEKRNIMKNYTYDITNILNDIYLGITNITIFIVISLSSSIVAIDNIYINFNI